MEILNGWTIEYQGKFSDLTTIEGKYNVSGSTGDFQIWISDRICPGLSFASLNITFQRKKKIKNVEYEWEGYYIQNSKKGPMHIKMLVGKDGTVKGKGLDVNGPFSINGTHENYTSISFIKKMESLNYSIYYDGEFVDDVTIEGKYCVDGFLGNFKKFL